MRLKIAAIIFAQGLLFNCKWNPYSNKRTSHIYDLNSECVSDSAWTFLRQNHPLKDIKDPRIQSSVGEFEKMPFETELFYFQSGPEEIIAVSKQHDYVRYVFSPEIENNVLDGLSPGLTKRQKERVGNRIQSVLRRFQCSDERNIRYRKEWDDDKY